jgi:hypothetical protein
MSLKYFEFMLSKQWVIGKTIDVCGIPLPCKRKNKKFVLLMLQGMGNNTH